MDKYQRGKVYAIICRKTGRRYIGSSCEPTLAKRLAKHVNDFKQWKEGKGYFTSFDIIKDGDYYIVLLELYPCNSKDELRMCEQKHIDSCECVNKVKAFQSKEEKKEYDNQYCVEYNIKNQEQISMRKKNDYDKNPQEMRERVKKNYQKHRDKYLEKLREKVFCPHCNKEMNFSTLYGHKKRCPQLKKDIVTSLI